MPLTLNVGVSKKVGLPGLLVVPLVTALLRSARQIAMAAEVRTYSARRVPARELRFSRWDWGVLLGLRDAQPCHEPLP